MTETETPVEDELVRLDQEARDCYDEGRDPLLRFARRLISRISSDAERIAIWERGYASVEADLADAKRIHEEDAKRIRELEATESAAKAFVDWYEDEYAPTDPGDGTTGSQLDPATAIALDNHEEAIRQSLTQKGS